MSRDKYLSLEEARKSGKLMKQFAKEHPSVGDEEQFDRLLERMAKGKPKEKTPPDD
ncbi:MAG: hypothetical protein HYW28_12745 [Rhodospirillales bacterium]|nr:hypothetical protein [Rhodospirillales bacterium]